MSRESRENGESRRRRLASKGKMKISCVTDNTTTTTAPAAAECRWIALPPVRAARTGKTGHFRRVSLTVCYQNKNWDGDRNFQPVENQPSLIFAIGNLAFGPKNGRPCSPCLLPARNSCYALAYLTSVLISYWPNPSHPCLLNKIKWITTPLIWNAVSCLAGTCSQFTMGMKCDAVYFR